MSLWQTVAGFGVRRLENKVLQQAVSRQALSLER